MPTLLLVLALLVATVAPASTAEASSSIAAVAAGVDSPAEALPDAAGTIEAPPTNQAQLCSLVAEIPGLGTGGAALTIVLRGARFAHSRVAEVLAIVLGSTVSAVTGSPLGLAVSTGLLAWFKKSEPVTKGFRSGAFLPLDGDRYVVYFRCIQTGPSPMARIIRAGRKAAKAQSLRTPQNWLPVEVGGGS